MVKKSGRAKRLKIAGSENYGYDDDNYTEQKY